MSLTQQTKRWPLLGTQCAEDQFVWITVLPGQTGMVEVEVEAEEEVVVEVEEEVVVEEEEDLGVAVVVAVAGDLLTVTRGQVELQSLQETKPPFKFNLFLTQ